MENNQYQSSPGGATSAQAGVLTRTTITNAIKEAVGIGILKERIAAGRIEPEVTLAEAKKLYGETHIRQWQSEGLIKPRVTGTGRKFFDRLTCEILYSSEKSLFV